MPTAATRSWCRPHKVHDVRLKLAAAGLPKGSVAGFELIDNARFGQTQFQERLTFQRALEGELTRSISALAAVQTRACTWRCRNQNGFFREQQKPSASVLLHAARRAARSSARRSPASCTWCRQRARTEPQGGERARPSGTLLSGAGGDNAANGLDAQQLQYVQQIEASYVKRVIEILEPVVGRDNLRASVTADVDFSQSEATAEAFKPNQGKDAAASVRSQQTVGIHQRRERHAVRRARRAEQPAAGAGDRAADRRRQRRCRPPAAAAASGVGAARQRHQLRGRQDRARDAQCHRHASSGSTPRWWSTTARSPTPRARPPARRCRATRSRS